MSIETPAPEPAWPSPAFWKSLTANQRVEVDMGPPPTTRDELRDRCAAVRVVAELHGLSWARVVDSPRLVFRFWYPTEEEVRREKSHRRALERQARGHVRWVTSDHYRNKLSWRMTRQEAAARKGRDSRGRFLPRETMQ